MIFKVASASIATNLLLAGSYNYINTGKKFNMLSRKDFIGSIGIKHNEESVVENHIHGTKTKRGAYKSLTKKSGTPSWLKEKL